MPPNNAMFGHSCQGYLLPCCWCDNIIFQDKYVSALYDPEIKIENKDTIDEIIESPQWRYFVDAIQSEDPPKVCQHFCGETEVIKEIIRIKSI